MINPQHFRDYIITNISKMTKTIKISDETHKKLSFYKLEKGFSNFDNTINDILLNLKK